MKPAIRGKTSHTTDTFDALAIIPYSASISLGDLERTLLHQAQIHSAGDLHSALEPVMARHRDEDIRRFFRGNAAFANPNICTFLEEEDYLYAIRLPPNQDLQCAQRSFAKLLPRNSYDQDGVRRNGNDSKANGRSVQISTNGTDRVPR